MWTFEKLTKNYKRSRQPEYDKTFLNKCATKNMEFKQYSPESNKSKVISIVSRVELCNQVFNEVSSFH